MNRNRELRSGARVALAELSVEHPDVGLPVSIETIQGIDEEPVASVVSGNISTGGVGFWLEPGMRQLVVGDRVTVRFTLPDSFDELLVRAEVRHVTDHPKGGSRVGARFIDADELVEHPLFRYIEESLLAVRATTESYVVGLGCQ